VRDRRRERDARNWEMENNKIYCTIEKEKEKRKKNDDDDDDETFTTIG
jgi:hypothetical protein